MARAGLHHLTVDAEAYTVARHADQPKAADGPGSRPGDARCFYYREKPLKSWARIPKNQTITLFIV